MLRFLCVAMIVIAASALTAAPAAASPPPKQQAAASRIATLTFVETKRYVRRALKWNFGVSWTSGYGKWVRPCDRRSRLRITCTVSWHIGDMSYGGRATIGARRNRNGREVWWYAYRITSVDGYCADTGGTDCTRYYRAP